MEDCNKDEFQAIPTYYYVAINCIWNRGINTCTSGRPQWIN